MIDLNKQTTLRSGTTSATGDVGQQEAAGLAWMDQARAKMAEIDAKRNSDAAKKDGAK